MRCSIFNFSHSTIPPFVAGGVVVAGVDTGTDSGRPGLRPLSRVVAMSLVVIGALVWWESRRPGWAVASSLVALAALFAVSTMMASRGVLVSTAGPGLAIVAGALGRRALETVIAFRNRGGGGALRGAKRPAGATRRFTPAARPRGHGVNGSRLAEEGGSRTHQTRGTRLTGFEVRAPHRGAILFLGRSHRPPCRRCRRRTGARGAGRRGVR